MYYPHIHRVPNSIDGNGIFLVQSITPYKATFRSGKIVKGYFSSFRTNNGDTWENIPCSIFVKSKQKLANNKFELEGQIIKKQTFNRIIFKPKKGSKWKAIKSIENIAFTRHVYKKKISHFLSTQLPHKRSADFLSALVTGNLTNRTMKFEFGRLGLQHILAISGFHFGIVTAILGLFLRCFLPKKWVFICLFILVQFYYLFIGSSPSIQRAWVMIQLFLLAQIFSRRVFPVNFLSVAVIVEVLLDPLVLAHLGFYLSFFACLGIFFFYSPIEKLFRKVFPKRFPIKKNWKIYEKLFARLSNYFRSTISLMLAINIMLIPILLQSFGVFPLLSFLYNLFFPIAVATCIFILIIGITLTPIPYLGATILYVTDLFTYYLLTLVTYPPLIMDYQIRYCHMNIITLLVVLFLAISLGIYLNGRKRVKHL